MTLVEGEVYFQHSDQLKPGPGASGGPAVANGKFKAIPRNSVGDYVLRGLMVHPVSGPALPNAVVTIRKGKIAAVANSSEVRDPTVIDATGLHLYPGMIDAATVLGLTELGSARETNDFAEGGDFQPDLRASIAINPDSELIPVTRANGVTTVVTRPTGSLIAGQSALINLAGWVPKEMAVVDPLALHVEFPSPFRAFAGGDPGMRRLGQAITRKQREEKVRRLKELFQQAVAYNNARRQGSDKSINPRLEALAPYAHGQKPVIIQVQRRQEILDALKL